MSREFDCYCIGRLGSTYGYKGYLHVSFYSDTSFALEGATVLCSSNKMQVFSNKLQEHASQEHVIQDIIKAQSSILKFRAIANKEEAHKLINNYLFAKVQDIAPPADNEYFLHDLIGLTVLSRDTENLGVITGVITSAHPVLLEIRWNTSERTSFIPFIKEFFSELQRDNNSLILYVPELKE